jgi:hypothetical protein
MLGFCWSQTEKLSFELKSDPKSPKSNQNVRFSENFIDSWLVAGLERHYLWGCDG